MEDNFDTVDTQIEEDIEDDLGDISPRIGMPLHGPISSRHDRRQSKSILDVICIEKDNTDSGGFSEDENVTPDQSKAKEFFQYRMNNKDRGVFVIFNHKKFTLKNARERTGTDIDRDNLFDTARGLGFTVFTHDNLGIESLRKVVRQYAEIDYSDCDCFACAILTHGESGDILYAKDGKYSIKDILSPFRNCSSLVGKPKLFFVQACRGNILDHGFSRAEQDYTDAGGFNGAGEEPASIPVEADFFIGYSTVEGYYAWRNGENGSWFIQALCFCLKKYGADMELMQIMTRVNRMVAYDFESNVSNPLHNKKKQMPSIVTRLTGDVYFQSPGRETTVDGPEQQPCKSVNVSHSNAHSDPQEKFLKSQLLRTKIELARIRREQAEVSKKEQDLAEQLLEYKLSKLK